MNTSAALFPGFETRDIATSDGVVIRTRSAGQGWPLLLLHGHPQTHAMWNRVAPDLARHFTVVLADLRGYGDSTRPPADPAHASYSKRVMAADMVAVMQAHGFERFDVLAHDRGARVAHRLGLDHAGRVGRMALLDIAPTLDMYNQSSEAFARAYWHWFFLIQPAPLPERLIEADPVAFVRDVMGRRGQGLSIFAPAALAEYERAIALPGSARGICEDYRAAASIDLEHDRASRAAGERLPMPLLVLWGSQGVVQRCFDPLALWQQQADDVRGAALDCGHYIAEETPQALLERLLPFFQPTGARFRAGSAAGHSG